MVYRILCFGVCVPLVIALFSTPAFSDPGGATDHRFLLTKAPDRSSKEHRQPRGVKAKLRANYVVVVADDFVVDVYHNGVYVPDSKRKPVLDRFGASAERIDIAVHDGDWLVFNVVNNRLRWGGAYYFAAAGCFDKNEFGFVSQLKSAAWSACDSPSDVQRFIGEREYLRNQSAVAVSRPWHEGTKLMQRYAGPDWDGDPVWGSRRNTWLKAVVEPENEPTTASAKKKRRSE